LNSFKRTFNFIHQHPLAKNHLLRAYYRFISWQLRLRFSDKLIPVTFLSDTKVFAKRGLTGITGSIYTGLHEFEDMSFLLHLLRDTDTFFDVGANVGSYTILASGVCGCRTLSFEPVPATFEILKKNIDLNHLQQNIKAIPAGVGYERELLHFTANQDTTNHVIPGTETMTDTISVLIVSLDEYYSESPLLIKIDVEGFETEVLRGATNLLQQNSLKAIIIELNGSGNRYNFDDDLIHLNLTKLGFQPYHYDPFNRKLIELKSYGSFNTIYLRDLPFIKERLNSAKPFTVFSQSI
jgi:FkbM family methyltransferase